jgi:hypothetical protein
MFDVVQAFLGMWKPQLIPTFGLGQKRHVGFGLGIQKVHGNRSRSKTKHASNVSQAVVNGGINHKLP